MGVIVNLETGEFVATGELDALCEELKVLAEMGCADNLRLYSEDEAYSEF